MTKRLRPDQFPPWYDGQSINEAAFCREFLASHKLLYTENSFFTPEGRMTDEAPLKTEIYQIIEPYASTSVPKKISNIIELLKITAHIDDFPPRTDRIHVANGTLFLDERCSVSADAPTANWLIYGHNMHDGSMFGQLVRYRDEDFYKAHPTFTFDTLYEGGTWQVVAAVDTALGADALPYYTFFDADTKLDWQHRVRAITEKALYDTGVMPEYGAQLLTLSTCGDTHPDTDARFALLAVRID